MTLEYTQCHYQSNTFILRQILVLKDVKVLLSTSLEKT